MAVSTVFAKPFNVASPVPYTPPSVSTRVKTQFFHGLPTIYVVTSVIFMRSARFQATSFLNHEVAALQIIDSDLRRQSASLARRYKVLVRGCSKAALHQLPRLQSSSRLQAEVRAIHPTSFEVHRPVP